MFSIIRCRKGNGVRVCNIGYDTVASLAASYGPAECPICGPCSHVELSSFNWEDLGTFDCEADATREFEKLVGGKKKEVDRKKVATHLRDAANAVWDETKPSLRTISALCSGLANYIEYGPAYSSHVLLRFDEAADALKHEIEAVGLRAVRKDDLEEEEV